MKFLIIFAIFLLMQTLCAQQQKDDHQPDHINQQNVANQINKEGHQVETTITPPTQQNSVGHSSKVSQQNVQDVVQHVTQQVAQHNKQNVKQHTVENVNQHVTHQVASVNQKPTIHNSSIPHKVSVQIPPQVQHVVTHVSQHIPNVVAQHVANQNTNPKQRMIRSLVQKLKLIEKPRKCSYECSPLDPQVCAFNGRCYQEFESQCEMSAFNCLNTQKRFHLAHDAACQDLSAVKCYPGDM